MNLAMMGVVTDYQVYEKRGGKWVEVRPAISDLHPDLAILRETITKELGATKLTANDRELFSRYAVQLALYQLEAINNDTDRE